MGKLSRIKQRADYAQAKLEVYKRHGCSHNPFDEGTRLHRFYEKMRLVYLRYTDLESEMDEVYGGYERTLKYPKPHCQHEGPCHPEPVSST